MGEVVLDSLRKQYVELHQGGKEVVNKIIEDYKKNGGTKPILNDKVMALQIKQLMTINDKVTSRITNQQIWKYLLETSFECEMLRHELDTQKDKIRIEA